MPTNLTIPGIKGNFYGGYPYAIDLNIGTFDTPSTLTISVINEDGVYATPSLSWSNIVTITMGSLTFNGYLYEYKINKSISQKTMDLHYEDCSKILDKIQIGLHKRHGVNPNGISYSPTLNYSPKSSSPISNSWLWVLGKEIHPCDLNKNGIIDSSDIVSGSQNDWCDPCPNCPTDKYKYRCTAQNDMKIFDVGYSFRELCEKAGIGVPSLPSVDTVLRTYTGTLRNVLQSWCREFGLSFYWSFGSTGLSGGLVLFDRTVPITVNTSIDECKTTDVYEGESIKNSFAASTVSYYGRQGNRKSYECTDSKIYTLHTLRIRDLLNQNAYPNINTQIRWMEMGICLSYYSSSLRDCLYWFNFYGLKNAEAAKLAIATTYAPGLSFFGGMKIKKVITAASDSSLFTECKNSIGDMISIYDQRSKSMKREASNPAYYFFVAEVDEEALRNQAQRDVDLAEQFIGNHWVRITNGPGCDGGSSNIRYGGVSIDDPEGSSNWYNASSDSIFLDFAKFGHDDSSSISKFLSSKGVDAAKAPKKDHSVDIGGGVKKILEATASFIYKQRNASWYPNKGQMSSYQSLMTYYSSLCFNLVGKKEQGQDQTLLAKIDPSYVGKNNLAVFIVQEIDTPTLPVTITSTENFLEPKTQKIIRGKQEELEVCMSYKDANQSRSNDSGPILGSYGLADNKCAWVTFDGFSFMTPVQSTELLTEITSSALGDNPYTPPVGGYRVRATATYHAPVCIPKIQKSVIEVSSEVGQAGRHELNFSDITDDDIRIFGSKSCVPDSSLIMDIHKAKAMAFQKSKVTPERLSEYKVVGVAPDGIPSIADGLDSVKISVNDNGVFTNFSLSDKIAQPFSEAVIMNNILMTLQHKNNPSNYATVDHYPVKTAANSVIPNGV